MIRGQLSLKKIIALFISASGSRNLDVVTFLMEILSEWLRQPSL